MRLSRLIAAVFIVTMVMVGALLMIDNSVPVTLRVLDWTSPELSLFWWITAALLSGALIGMAATWPTVLRLQLALRAQRRSHPATASELTAEPARDPVQ